MNYANYIPVTHNGKTILLHTKAPFPIVTAAFRTTKSPEELIARLESRGYGVGVLDYGDDFNYDKKE